MNSSYALRDATAPDAEPIAALHAESWGDKGWGAYLHNLHVVHDRARNADTIELADPGGGHAPNCRYAWADARVLL